MVYTEWEHLPHQVSKFPVLSNFAGGPTLGNYVDYTSCTEV